MTFFIWDFSEIASSLLFGALRIAGTKRGNKHRSLFGNLVIAFRRNLLYTPSKIVRDIINSRTMIIWILRRFDYYDFLCLLLFSAVAMHMSLILTSVKRAYLPSHCVRIFIGNLSGFLRSIVGRVRAHLPAGARPRHYVKTAGASRPGIYFADRYSDPVSISFGQIIYV